jgi:response regulator RpfG family c-di-GMP phosphodiesterase
LRYFPGQSAGIVLEMEELAMKESVLFVDDNNFTLEIVIGLLSGCDDFHLLTAGSAVEALQIIRREEIAVVVSDNIMPDISGLEFLSSLKDISPDTVKILMSAYADLASALAAINRSEVFRYVLKPWKDEDMVTTVRDALNRYRLTQAMHRDDEDVLRSLAQTIELKDHSTKGHCDRVAVYALLIAERYGLSRVMLREIKYGSWLHDCGKIGISELILNGPERLSDEQFETMKQHSYWGADVAAKANLSQMTRNIIHYHHERYNGTGYPSGLKAEEIPIEARMVSVADVFDALTSERSYRPGFSRDETVKMISAMSGEALDPQFVEIFLDILREREDFPLCTAADA